MTVMPGTQRAQQKAQQVGRALGKAWSGFDAQCLRVLQCTARALASSPGGLRFKPGTRAWLHGLTAQGVRA